MNFKSILYLDDRRIPTVLGITRVKNYDEFIEYLTNNPVPELISFDHDLGPEHYSGLVGEAIPYDTYTEKTGLDCARWVVNNNIRLNLWCIHSSNPIGRRNIEKELYSYCPAGEIQNFDIPYRMENWIDISKCLIKDKRFAPII